MDSRDAPEILDEEIPFLDEALIQIELKKEEKIYLEVNTKKSKVLIKKL